MRSPPGSAASEPLGSPSVKILLVDDRRENLVALREVLAEPSYELHCAPSGRDALRLVLMHDYAVIVMDVAMPDMDGFEVVSMIKQRPRSRHVPIIFLTASESEVEFVYKAYSLGGVEYLIKPADPDILRSKVAVFVDLYRKGQEIKQQAELLRELEHREQERRLAEYKRASEQRYQNLAEAIPQIVWTMTPEGEVDYLNQRWSEYTGMSLESSRGWGWLAAVHEADAPLCLGRWRDAMQERTPFETECRLRNGDEGGYRWHLCRGRPEYAADGTLTAWLGTFTDIEERTQLLRRERSAREQAEEALHLRDEFLSVASHELKTPLTPLQLGIESALRRVASEPGGGDSVRSKLEVAVRQVRRLTRLVETLLDVTRIANDGLRLDLEELDLAELVRDMVARFSEQLAAAECRTTIEAPEPVVGRWDRLRVEAIVSNLISNACKYAAGHPIDIKVHARGLIAELVVRDHGMGIAPEHQAHIFERFGRAVSARNYGGLGLGLYIVREVVQAHGGQIRLASTTGQGATFTVELPREAGSAHAPLQIADG
jgi:PAS domain S-box-containing protein